MSNSMISQSLFGGKIVISRDRYHRYVIERNEINPKRTGIITASVTGVLKMLNKPGLVPWASGCAVDYLRDVFKTKGTLTEQDFELARQAHTAKSKGAAIIGGNVDDAISGFIQAQLEGYAWKRPALTPVEAKAFDAFLSWVRTENIKFASSQRILYSPELDIAGCMDVEYYKKGILVKSDFKTGDLPKYRSEFEAGHLWLEWIVQIGSYAYMDGIEIGYTQGQAALEAYHPAQSILVLDKTNGDFLECPIKTEYEEAATVLLYLNGIYKSKLYQARLARDREKWGRAS